MNKIFSLEQMGHISRNMKIEAKTIVHAHGTFDLLHVGHVKYLQQAKKYGDLLLVTVTADKFVNKGPNKPVFPEALRADMLSALECVDYVVITHNSDAIEAIEKVKPDFYIKGKDYQNPDGDITGKIIQERECTEKGGGKFIITDTEQFSSSSLINQHLNVYEPHIKDYLDNLRGTCGLEAMTTMIDSIIGKKILIIGEKITDVYQYVIPLAKASKESILTTRYQDNENFEGGSTMVRDMLKGFSDKISRTAWERTITKTRFVDPAYNRKLFEVSYLNDDPITIYEESYLHARLRDIEDYDVVIVLDYGHGMISQKTVKLLCARAKFLAVNTQTNSANMGFNFIHKYPRADYICIDMPEARFATCDKYSPPDAIVRKISEMTNCGRVIVTNGKHGCITYDKSTEIVHTIPAITKTVTDTIGAGDAFLAITAPLVAAGYPLDKIGFVGNIAGAIKTGIIGHKRVVNRIDMVKALTGLLK